MILCNKETGEPYAEVASSWVIEGEEYLKEDVKCNCTCKSNKHLVIGDKVSFGPHKSFIGEIEKIDVYDWENSDLDWWDYEIHLKNCISIDEDIISETQSVKRRYCDHLQYLFAEMKWDENRLWNRIRKDFDSIELTPDNIFEFFKARTTPSK